MNEKNVDTNFRRRKFIGKASLAMAGIVVAPGYILPTQQSSDRKIRIGIIGGRFGTSFQFHEHSGF